MDWHGKPNKFSDEKGLYLIVRGTAKLWRYDYRFGGKRKKTLALGSYPDVSLRDARERRNEARRQIAAGVRRLGGRIAMSDSM